MAWPKRLMAGMTDGLAGMTDSRNDWRPMVGFFALLRMTDGLLRMTNGLAGMTEPFTAGAHCDAPPVRVLRWNSGLLCLRVVLEDAEGGALGVGQGGEAADGGLAFYRDDVGGRDVDRRA